MAGLPIGKKRFYISLTEKNMLFLQEWNRKKGIPPANVSMIFDDLLAGVCRMLQEFDKKEEIGEEITMSDIFGITERLMTEAKEKVKK